MQILESEAQSRIIKSHLVPPKNSSQWNSRWGSIPHYESDVWKIEIQKFPKKALPKMAVKWHDPVHSFKITFFFSGMEISKINKFWPWTSWICDWTRCKRKKFQTYSAKWWLNMVIYPHGIPIRKKQQPKKTNPRNLGCSKDFLVIGELEFFLCFGSFPHSRQFQIAIPILWDSMISDWFIKCSYIDWLTIYSPCIYIYILYHIYNWLK